MVRLWARRTSVAALCQRVRAMGVLEVLVGCVPAPAHALADMLGSRADDSRILYRGTCARVITGVGARLGVCRGVAGPVIGH